MFTSVCDIHCQPKSIQQNNGHQHHAVEIQHCIDFSHANHCADQTTGPKVCSTTKPSVGIVEPPTSKHYISSVDCLMFFFPEGGEHKNMRLRNRSFSFTLWNVRSHNEHEMNLWYQTQSPKLYWKKMQRYPLQATGRTQSVPCLKRYKILRVWQMKQRNNQSTISLRATSCSAKCRNIPNLSRSKFVGSRKDDLQESHHYTITISVMKSHEITRKRA